MVHLTAVSDPNERFWQKKEPFQLLIPLMAILEPYSALYIYCFLYAIFYNHITSIAEEHIFAWPKCDYLDLVHPANSLKSMLSDMEVQLCHPPKAI